MRHNDLTTVLEKKGKIGVSAAAAYLGAIGYAPGESVVISCRKTFVATGRDGEPTEKTKTKVFFGCYRDGTVADLSETMWEGRDESGVSIYSPYRPATFDDISRLADDGWDVLSHPNHAEGGLGKKHVCAFTALFCEWDDLGLDDQRRWAGRFAEWGIPPTMTVFSGSKSVHTYFALSRPATAAEWKRLQRKIAVVSGSDPQLCTENRSMRLPGVFRVKGGVRRLVEIESLTDVRHDPAEFERILDETGAFPHGLDDRRWRKWSAASASAQDKADALLKPTDELFPPRALPDVSTYSYGGTTVPLMRLLTRDDVALIENGVAENRNCAGNKLATNLYATANFLESEGISFDPADPKVLFDAFAERSSLGRAEADGVWRSSTKGSPSPSRPPESILSAVRWWELENDPSVEARRHAVRAQTAEIVLDAEERHREYRRILDELVLDSADRRTLANLGLNVRAIGDGEFRSVGKLQQISGTSPFVPGVAVTGISLTNPAPGVLFPVRDELGRIVALGARMGPIERLLRSATNPNRKFPCDVRMPDGEYPLAVVGQAGSDLLLAGSCWDAATVADGSAAVGSWGWRHAKSPGALRRAVEALNPPVIYVRNPPDDEIFIARLRRIKALIESWGDGRALWVEIGGELLPYERWDDGSRALEPGEIDREEWLARFGADPEHLGAEEHAIGKTVARMMGRAVRRRLNREAAKAPPDGVDIGELESLADISTALVPVGLDRDEIDLMNPGDDIEQTWIAMGKPTVRAIAYRHGCLPEPELWREMGSPTISYGDDEQLDIIYEAQAKGYHHLHDASTAGAGKSHSIGAIDNGRFPAEKEDKPARIFYFSADRNPSVPTIEDRFEQLPSRHPGLVEHPVKKTPAGRPHVRRWKPGDPPPDIPTNCPEAGAFAIASERDMGIYGGKDSPICRGCPLFDGESCDFMRSRARVLEEEIRIRGHLQAAPKPRPSDVWIVEEAGVTIDTNKNARIPLSALRGSRNRIKWTRDHYHKFASLSQLGGDRAAFLAQVGAEHHDGHAYEWSDAVFGFAGAIDRNLQRAFADGATGRYKKTHAETMGMLPHLPRISREDLDWMLDESEWAKKCRRENDSLWRLGIPPRWTAAPPQPQVNPEAHAALAKVPIAREIEKYLRDNPPIVPGSKFIEDALFDAYWDWWVSVPDIWRLEAADGSFREIVPSAADVAERCRNYLKGRTEKLAAMTGPGEKEAWIRLNSYFNWVEPVFDAVRVGSARTGLSADDGAIYVTKKYGRHVANLDKIHMGIFLDATLSTGDLARELRTRRDEILRLEKRMPQFSNLTVRVVREVGVAGANRRHAQQDRLMAAIAGIADRHPDAKVAVCDRKDKMPLYEPLVVSGAIDKTGYWHVDSRGSNQFKDVDALALVGMPTPNLGAMAAEWQVLSGQTVEPADLSGTYGAWVRRKATAELIQAIARPRAHLKRDRQVYVYLLSSQVTDKTAAEIRRAYPGCRVEVEDGYSLAPDCVPKGEGTFRGIVEFVFGRLKEGEPVKAKDVAAALGTSPPNVTKTLKTHTGGGFMALRKNLLLLLEIFNSGSKFLEFEDLDEECRFLAEEVFPLTADDVAEGREDPEALDRMVAIVREEYEKPVAAAIFANIRRSQLFKIFQILFRLLPEASAESFDRAADPLAKELRDRGFSRLGAG